ncbi:cache domain-containing protein, partial [Brachyspira alvinipulli]|uniref:methyl-accepting chemotaxis protein n=1 Tax=Brachyspira alvinipulli TaxID=84379 RepID=UPI0030052ABB
MFKRFDLKLQITISILLPIILIIILANGLIILYTSKISKNLSYRVLEETSYREVNNIENNIKKHIYTATGFKINIENLYKSGIRDRNSYKEMTSLFFENLPNDINGLAIMFESNVIGSDNDYINSEYKESDGRFNYYISKNGEAYLGINSYNMDYYTEPKKTGEVYTTGVYSSAVNVGKMIFTLCIPIKPDNKFIGVICVDIFVDSITSLLGNISPFKDTTVALYDQNGAVLYDSFDINNVSKNIYEVYPHYKQYNVFENFISGKHVIIDAYGEKSKKYVTYTFAPIKVANGTYWGLEFTTPKNIILKDSNILRNISIAILLLIIAVFALLIPSIVGKKVSSIINLLAKDILAMAEGDLTKEIPANFNNRRDEWGDIARGWDKAMNNFNKVINTVKNSAEQVSTAANEVLVGNNDLSQRTESQAS